MSLSLYKLATKENHTYQTEGVFYYYKTCEDDELKTYLADGWITSFADLKGKTNEVQNKGQKAQDITKDDLVKILTDAGVEFDKRLGFEKLKELADALD